MNLATVCQHPAWRLVNQDEIRLLDTPDDREPTCDICYDDTERMVAPIVYLEHVKCRRSCHASCILEYLADENSCLCPYCRSCLKTHDTPDLCVLFEPFAIGLETGDSETGETEDEPRNFEVGLREDIWELVPIWDDLSRFRIDDKRWLCQILHGDRNHSENYRGPPDRVFNEINAISSASRLIFRTQIPPEMHQLTLDSQRCREDWLKEWNTFIDQLRIPGHQAATLNDLDVLYDYCDDITTAFMNLRARETLVDLLYRWELVWLAEDRTCVRHGILTETMLARRRFLYVQKDGEEGWRFAAGHIDGALRQLEPMERRLQRRWKQTREAIVTAWETEVEQARQALFLDSRTLWEELQAVDLFPPLPLFELPRMEVCLSFTELAGNLKKW